MNIQNLLFSEQASLQQLYGAALTALFFFVLFITLKTIFTIIAEKYRKKDRKSFIYILSISIERFPVLTGIVLASYIGIISLPLNEELLFYRILEILILLLTFFSISASFNYGVRRYTAIISERITSSSRRNYLLYSSVVVRTLVWVIFSIVFLTNIGLEVSAIVAGLGLSGFALAIAFRNLIKDILASFIIVLDRIVEVGDRIKVSDEIGTVSKIGVKSSRLLTDAGLEIIIPNTHLVDKKVLNLNQQVEIELALVVEIEHSEKDVITILEKALGSEKYDFIKTDSLSIALEEITTEKKIYSIKFVYNKDQKSIHKHLDTLINEVYYSLSEGSTQLRVALDSKSE